MSQLPGSLAIAAGGTTNFVIAGGQAVVSTVVAAFAFLPLFASSWDAFLGVFGRKAAGRVTAVERSGPRMWKRSVSFRIDDGRQISFRQNVPRYAAAGGSVIVHYWPARPQRATSLSARRIAARFVPSLTLEVAALAGLGGTLYTVAAGGFATFASWYAIGLFLVPGVLCLGMAYLRYAEISWWQGKAVAAGRVARLETVTQPPGPQQPRPRDVYPWVSFTTSDGREIEFQEKYAGFATVGSQVEVLYDPQIPEQTATIWRKNRTVRATATVALTGLVLIASAVVLAWGQLTGSG